MKVLKNISTVFTGTAVAMGTVALVGAGFLLLPTGTAASENGNESGDVYRYEIDPVHSSVVFRIKHFDTTWVYGRFNEKSGEIHFSADDPAQTVLNIEILTASIDTNNSRRDDHLRSPDFFTAEQYETISFHSKSVRHTDGDKFEITGDLTVSGVTKEVTVPFEITGHGESPRGDVRIGGHATFDVNRSEYGVDYMMDGLSDQVTLMVSLQAIRQE